MPVKLSGFITNGDLSLEAGNIDANGNVDPTVYFSLAMADQALTFKPNSDGNNPITLMEFYGAARALIQGYYFVSGSSPASSSIDICDVAFNSSPLTTFSIGRGLFRSNHSVLRPEPNFTDEMPSDGDYVYVFIGDGQSGEGGPNGFWQEFIWNSSQNLLICTNQYVSMTCLLKPNGSAGGGLPTNPYVPPYTISLLRTSPKVVEGLCNATYETIWSDASSLSSATQIFRREPNGSGGYDYPLAYGGWYSQDGSNARKWSGSSFTANSTYVCV